MVDYRKTRQFEGFDFNDFVTLMTTAIVPDADSVGMYIAGTMANNALISPLAGVMALVPQPTPGGPLTAIGPQYPWPYEGSMGPLPPTMPVNPAPVQKTLVRVVGNDMYFHFLDYKMVRALYALLVADNEMLAAGPSLGNWPLPIGVRIFAGRAYEMERKWIWLFFQRAVEYQDAHAYVWMEG